MPSPNDITLMFARQHGAEPKDVILDLNELLEDIEDENWKQRLRDDKLSYAERTKSCPRCGEPLEMIDKWKESRGEMCGKEVHENMYKFGCTSCGYIKE
jgi:uncharacterized protein with PIN domain